MILSDRRPSIVPLRFSLAGGMFGRALRLLLPRAGR